jgi:hypothetical protein
MRISLVSLVSFLVLFLGSLRSLNFAALGGVRWFVILSFLILVLFSPYCKIGKSNIKFVITFYIFFLLNVVISILSFKVKPHYFSYIGFILCPAYFLLLVGFYTHRVKLLVKHLKVVLAIHLFFFYLQLFTFLIFDYTIDFIEFITHEPQRTIGGIFTKHTIIRSSGLFNEPASYSIFVVSMLLCLLFNNKKITFLMLVAIMSVVLSFSASGIMFLVVLIVLVFIKKSFFIKNLLIKISVVIVALVGINIYFGEKRVFEVFTSKLLNFQDSTSFQFRIGKIFDVFGDLNLYQKLFGLGFGNLSIGSNLGSFLSQFLVQSGLVFSFLFISLFYIIAKNYKLPKRIIFIVIVLSLSTQAINHLITWYFLASLLIISYNKFYENSTFNNGFR